MLVPKIRVLLAERLVKTYLSTLLFCSDVAEHVDLFNASYFLIELFCWTMSDVLLRGLLVHESGFVLKPVQAPPKGTREVAFYQVLVTF